MDIEGIHIDEDVEVHKKERFAKIEIPATKMRSAVTITQDFGQVTLYNLFLIGCIVLYPLFVYNDNIF